jgi:F-type H+-transporting ATPase subunit a
MPEKEALIHVELKAENLFSIGPLQVTNSMVGALMATAVLLLAAWYFTRSSSLVPNRMQSLIEVPIELMAGIVADTTSRWRGYVTLVVGFFLMILVANWLGLLPGVGTVGLKGEEGQIVPFVRPAGADVNFTLGLAIITFVVFVWWAIRLHGPIGYMKELAGEPRYMAPLMFPIHLISELSRLISLSMRLFGNVFAGEILLATMLAGTTAAIFLLPLAFFVPGIFLGLELLFGAVQALVFALLTMAYIILAIAEQGDGHDEERPHGDQSAHADTATPVTASS